ncbi:MAG: 3-deoxy-D-manno-octulosonic acid transferase [Candidatus Rokubacteria bacterium]|nr:3-deoxy-D-manno-octulosonic acid transferase [Candidatus Rokubacteria bacterium]
MYAIYTLVFALASLLYLPAFVLRMWRAGYPLALAERLGRVRKKPDGTGPRLWLHAVSVGELLAAVPLIQALHLRRPQLDVVVSTTTATAARLARERLSGVTELVTFPLDLPPAIRLVLNAMRPDAFVAMETELWPNLLRILRVRGIPAMIANGRISDRSFRRYRWVRFFLRRVLESVAVFAMQSEEDARRIILLGASPEKVHVTGNLKMESTRAEEGVERLWGRLLGLSDEAVWVAGSTRQGEEEIIARVYQALQRSHPSLVLILVPRHPERIPEVEALLNRLGIGSVRRSALPGQPRAAGGVILVDTVGELASLYAVADLVFMGGSLIPWGGQNMAEPALRGKPVLFGPHVENFRDAARLLLEARGAIQVQDGDELVSVMRRLLDDPEERKRLGDVARQAMAGQSGACQKTLDLVAQFLFQGPLPNLVTGESSSV